MSLSLNSWHLKNHPFAHLCVYAFFRKFAFRRTDKQTRGPFHITELCTYLYLNLRLLISEYPNPQSWHYLNRWKRCKRTKEVDHIYLPLHMYERLHHSHNIVIILLQWLCDRNYHDAHAVINILLICNVTSLQNIDFTMIHII